MCPCQCLDVANYSFLHVCVSLCLGKFLCLIDRQLSASFHAAKAFMNTFSLWVCAPFSGFFSTVYAVSSINGCDQSALLFLCCCCALSVGCAAHYAFHTCVFPCPVQKQKSSRNVLKSVNQSAENSKQH